MFPFYFKLIFTFLRIVFASYVNACELSLFLDQIIYIIIYCTPMLWCVLPNLEVRPDRSSFCSAEIWLMLPSPELSKFLEIPCSSALGKFVCCCCKPISERNWSLVEQLDTAQGFFLYRRRLDQYYLRFTVTGPRYGMEYYSTRLPIFPFFSSKLYITLCSSNYALTNYSLTRVNHSTSLTNLPVAIFRWLAQKSFAFPDLLDSSNPIPNILIRRSEFTWTYGG